MRKADTSRDTLGETLRQAAPPLGRADAARIARACARVAEIREEPRRRRAAFAKTLLRVAAGLAVLASVIALAKINKPSPVAGVPRIVSVPPFYALDAWMGQQIVTDTLADESANLASDLATLTTALNERSLAILF